jgi:hypothetical protein
MARNDPKPPPRDGIVRNQWSGRDTSHDPDIIQLHSEGLGRNDIARELAISQGAVTNAAKFLGLVFDGSQVLMATEIARREARARRQVLSLSLLDDVEHLQEVLWSAMKYVQYGGKNFERREDEYDHPMPADQSAIARAMGILLDRAVRLDEYDQRSTDMESANSFLDGIQVIIRGEIAQPPAIEAPDAPQD